MWSRSCKVSRSCLLPFLGVFLFIIQLGLSLGDLPSIRLMQDIVCKRHYEITKDELLSEEECRGEDVQQELNTIVMGILISLTVSSALVAFPLGIIADRVGRVPILSLSILSMLLSQAYVEALWGLGVPLLLGGGRSVAEAMVFAIIADVVPDKKRAVWFQWIVAAVLSGQLLGPLLAGVLVQPSIWLPLWISLGLITFGGVILAVFTPETLRRGQTPDIFNLDPSNPATWATLKFIFQRPMVWLLPGAVLTIPLATIQSDISIRLMPIQFDWRLDQSILLISLRSLAMLVTLCVLLPAASYLWTKLSTITFPHQRDRIFARASSLLFLAGSTCMMMVSDKTLVMTGLVVSALGSGIPMLCRAMLVGATGQERAGTMFGLLAVWEVLGFLGCEMGMGALFGVGLKTWIGMPFCLGMLVAFGIATATWIVPRRLLMTRNMGRDVESL
ncbi:Hypothetical protein NCS54_00685300 [Fusarium falciforme]|uniref:Hypothetical protein n=1 Tax=Fusarium falciforme TaxID=195108 RepID=UPI002300603B|nr:Hypothetical protein NCS54_00685300 [Fusarium falciforme]WAO89460.1 Hypothetical protein NCS54_00685300 [Fusarium falciforme]